MPKVYAPDDEKAAYNIALFRLGAQMRTKAQLCAALARKGFNEATVEKVIDKLCELELLDDEKYAERLVELQRTRGGRKRVAHKLWAHGIESETAQTALCAISDEDERMSACALAKDWLDTMQALPVLQRKQKITQRLLRRGFDFETIRDALRKLEMDEDEEL